MAEPSGPRVEAGAGNLQAISDWLADGASMSMVASRFMTEACERLVASGVPLWRVAVFVQTLHPDIFGRSFVWRPGTEVKITTADFGIAQSDGFLSSPLSVLYATGQEVRRRLVDDVENHNSPFLSEMREEGVTDYIALPLRFTDGSLHASSWTTRAPGGFTDAQLESLRKLISPMARLVEIARLRATAATLLDTYVGNRAGERILAGAIRRGHTETMNAAIWLSDMRGFTPLSDKVSPETMVGVLNAYFDCQVLPILKHGGEVLKFMGDGLLAVFPIAEDGSDAEQVCGAVLEAAQESRSLVAAMNYAAEGQTLDNFRFGLALHVGKLLYGNIGGGNRLDFTCIGPAVNLAARIEKIASQLNRTIVASSAFAKYVRVDWQDLGLFSVAGFADPERVYGLNGEVNSVIV